MDDVDTLAIRVRAPWSRGKLIGQKPPLKLTEVSALRSRLQMAGKAREALLNLAIDRKLRACDLVRLRVRDVAHGAHVLGRAAAVQQKTGQPVLKVSLTGSARPWRHVRVSRQMCDRFPAIRSPLGHL